MQTIHYFAGANTVQGFYSRFEEIPRDCQRVYYIKGGPGVGKSTLMKRVAQRAQEKGLEAEIFHCSSDPDSLDGVALPQKRLALMDGTAPHVYDPVVPGARDTLLSLGDYLDEKALRPLTGEIIDVQSRISTRFARAYRYLAAAGEVLRAAPHAREDEAKTARLADAWAHSLPLRGGRGSVRQLFASAFTPKGLLTITDFHEMERCVTVDCPFGAHATGLLHTIARMAAARGLDAVELLDPLFPQQIAHVLIPAHGVAFSTGRRTKESTGEWVDADSVFAGVPEADREQSFDINAFELLCQRAVEQLAAAHQLHDELENYYIRHMDFLGWEKALEKVLSQIE